MSRVRRIVLTALLIGVVATTAACSGGPATTPVSSTSSSSARSSSPVHASSSTPAASGTVDCAYPASGTAAKQVDPPNGSGVAATGTVDVTLHMDAGDVVLDLDRSMAPCATNSLVWLAEQGYFDDTSCHRLVPGFVLQCGDPTGKGTGGPGYRFNDELSGRETYPYGTVAMANAGPNTNGSQFFIVIGEDVKLDPAYTVMGTVSQASMSVVDTIAAAGVDPTDPQGTRPAQGGHITSASVA